MGEATTSLLKKNDCTEGSLSSKCEKHCENENEDRISSLPDALLIHILTFLPTKYAVGTNILSTRWRYLWTSIPVLHFEESHAVRHLVDGRVSIDEKRCQELERLFSDSVEGVLLLHKVQSIQKFYLKFSQKCDAFRVNVWLRFAVMRNVVELDLDLCFRPQDRIQLPQSLFNSKKLKILKLRLQRSSPDSNIFYIPDSISLPSLKVLHLNLSYIDLLDDASLRKLLCGAPVLEQLEILRDGPVNMHTLFINSCSLRSLVIRILGFCQKTEHFEVVIDAPNLEFLELRDDISEEVKVTLLPSIVHAKIDVFQDVFRRDSDHANEVVQLLRQISNVKILCLTACMLKKLNEVKQEYLAAHNLITFHNLTHLEVTSWRRSLILVDVLEYMPNLEVLDLEIMPCSRWHFPEIVPQCLLSCLKMVQIKSGSAFKALLGIIEYFLKNAMVLEKMILSCYKDLRDLDTLKKLLAFPRASSSCQILFSKREPVIRLFTLPDNLDSSSYF